MAGNEASALADPDKMPTRGRERLGRCYVKIRTDL